jgi:L-ribulokinase
MATSLGGGNWGSETDGYVVGVDFGTLSGRAVVVRARDGAELGSAVSVYAHAVIEEALPATGEALPNAWALQDPDDYRDVLRVAVPEALRVAGVNPETVIGIGTDFTASTPMPVRADGTPLCEVAGFRDRPHAYPKLWKHHAAQAHAERVTSLAAERGEPWLKRYGGRISSEWEFAKALQILDEDPAVYEAMDRWIEAADWIVWQLCGHETRNVCTAGYKGIHQDGAYPSEDYLAALDPRFANFVADKLAHPLSPLGARAGGLTEEAAKWTGLRPGIAVAIGNVDAHVTAPAAKATAPGQMVAIMGTSTCHVMTAPRSPRSPACAASSTAGSRPGCGATRPGRAASATSSAGSSSIRRRRATTTTRAAAGSPSTST